MKTAYLLEDGGGGLHVIVADTQDDLVSVGWYNVNDSGTLRPSAVIELLIAAQIGETEDWLAEKIPAVELVPIWDKVAIPGRVGGEPDSYKAIAQYDGETITIWPGAAGAEGLHVLGIPRDLLS